MLPKGKWLQLLLNAIFVRKRSFLIERVNGRRKGFCKLSYFTGKGPFKIPWEFDFLLQTKRALIALLGDRQDRLVSSVQNSTKSLVLWKAALLLLNHVPYGYKVGQSPVWKCAAFSAMWFSLVKRKSLFNLSFWLPGKGVVSLLLTFSLAPFQCHQLNRRLFNRHQPKITSAGRSHGTKHL